MGSASALMRWKTRNGYKVYNTNSVSGYIVLCKIKKALLKDYTDDMVKHYIKKQNYAKSTRRAGTVPDRLSLINRFMVKLGKLPTESVQMIYSRYQQGGIGTLLHDIHQPSPDLASLKFVPLEK